MVDLDYIVNPITALLTAAGDVFILVLIVLYFIRRDVLAHAEAYILPALFVVALLGVVGSLFYSEILGYLPCDMCWWQRIFLYPQVIILGITLWRFDKNVWMYTLALSLVGAAIALYQYLLQWGLAPSVGCPVGGAFDCSAKIVLGLGYVTIPMMALTGFVLMIILSLMYRTYRTSVSL